MHQRVATADIPPDADVYVRTTLDPELHVPAAPAAIQRVVVGVLTGTDSGVRGVLGHVLLHYVMLWA